MSLTTRPLRDTDLPAIQPLIQQLGYNLTPAEIWRRFQAIMSARDHSVIVGEIAGGIVGLLHIYARPAFDKPPETVVQALVVDASTRKCGVGKALMMVAENWARQKGLLSVSLASDIVRGDAHAFYEAIGYSSFATSRLFRKELN